jgi:hypothetical protein
LDNTFTEPIGGVDEHILGKASVGIDGERDTR